MSARVHATCVAIREMGVLLLGPSESGKSDLTLRLIDGGAMLVADDQVALAVEGGRLVASAPPHLPPLLEVRGVGLVPLPCRARVPLAVAFSLVPGGQPERLPEPAVWEHAGVRVPRYVLDPSAASAAARVRLLAERAPLALEPQDSEAGLAVESPRRR
ncbi:MAG: hypothetical protein FJX64_04700 [Alphaproteobacteria bacterium]|nr:hypothetical protein [Alphaproteobacteria bacterium]